MAEEGTGGRGRGDRGGRRKGPEREGEGRKREGPHDTLAWAPQCLNPALDKSSMKLLRQEKGWGAKRIYLTVCQFLVTV